jgi:predicted dehydrogenase
LTEKIRVGVVGSGFGATVLVPGWQQCAGAEVVAIASARRARAEAVAAEAGIPYATDDYQDLLARVDLVGVATPPMLHYPMVLAAVGAGKHVLCEKPFAASAQEARAMTAAAEAAGVVHAVDHEFRFTPVRLHLSALLEAGYVGEPFLVRAADLSDRVLRGRQEAWWYSRAAGGGLFGAAGSHYVDALCQWVGDVAAVATTLDTALLRHAARPKGLPAEMSADDTVGLLLRFANGAQGTLHLTGLAQAPHRRVELYGTGGALVLEDDARVLGARDGAPLAEIPPARRAPPAAASPRRQLYAAPDPAVRGARRAHARAHPRRVGRRLPHVP